MQRPTRLLTLVIPWLVACGAPATRSTTATSATTATTSPAPADPPAPSTGSCDAHQLALSRQADERAHPHGIVPHLTKHFPDGRVSWLMREEPYQRFVVSTGAERFGRCDDTGCYVFAAPTQVIEDAVRGATTADGHDPARLGEALGLPADSFAGPLRLMTLDLDDATGACVRLPLESDPGVWKCEGEADAHCFRFGGYTSGGVPEVIVIDAAVAETTVVTIP
jgi:hypothetical protein